MDLILQKQTERDFFFLQKILNNIKDLAINEEKNAIKFNFKQLDFFELQKLAENNKCKILNDFVEKVEQIHSYTPQNGKRIYDYKFRLKL